MAEIVYRSGPDYDSDNPVMWLEEGELPSCVEPFRLGDFICRCGKHRVQAYVILDPLDSQDRVSRTVTLILNEEELKTVKKERILAECRRNLDRGRAVATGIGLFAVVVRNGTAFRSNDLLLRRRLEKDSLYQQDLSGKWEIPGGGVELSHFRTWVKSEDSEKRYCGSLFETLKQELAEEAGLDLLDLPNPPVILPAWFWKEYTDKETEEGRIAIDLAFSLPIPFEGSFIAQTKAFWEKTERGELMFISRDRLKEIEIVSPRMRFLIEIGLEACDLLDG